MQDDHVIVFLGPTLPLDRARELLEADYRPPGSRGDVYRAAKSAPSTIVLIDGAFEAGAAVLHNEILWALSKGVAVWGAASMGALRAAELAPFGMVGIGKIYEAYRDGTLERDDAVAVVHGPMELGYPLLSMPLVDVWATVEKAFAAGALSSEERALLRDVAGRIFYKRLGIDTLLETAVHLGLAESRKESIGRELILHQFSQKGSDAVEMLRAVAKNDRKSVITDGSDFVFERTAAFERFAAEQEDGAIEAALHMPVLGGVDEVAAIGLILAEQEAQRRGLVLTRSAFEETARQFRKRLGMSKSVQVQKWMEIARLEHDDYVKLVQEEFLLERVRALIENRRGELASRVDRIRRGSLGRMRGL